MNGISYQLTIAEDGLSVHAEFVPREVDDFTWPDVLSLTMEKLTDDLSARSISFALDADRLNEELRQICGQTEPQSLVLVRGAEPKAGVPGDLQYMVELGIRGGTLNAETGKKDHRDLGIMDRLVEPGRELVVIRREMQGRPGVDVYGQVLDPEPVEEMSLPPFDDASIEVEETEDGWVMRSSVRGFFRRNPEHGYLEVTQALEASRIDSTHVGNVISDGSIDVIIKGDRQSEWDAVAEGFRIVARRVEIDGNLGNHVQIEGQEVIIRGQVRSNGKIVAHEKLIADYVYGSELEGGDMSLGAVWHSTVQAQRVVVMEKVVGSTIMGNTLVALGESINSTLIACDRLAVSNTSAMEVCKLAIDPLAFAPIRAKRDTLESEIEKAEKQLEEWQKKLDHQNQIFDGMVKTVVDNLLRINGQQATLTQRLQLRQLFRSHQEGRWMKNLRTNTFVDQLLAKMETALGSIENVERSLAVLPTSLSMKRKELKRVNEWVKKGAIFCLGSWGEGTQVSFGPQVFPWENQPILGHKIYFDENRLTSSRSNVEGGRLRKMADDLDELTSTLSQA